VAASPLGLDLALASCGFEVPLPPAVSSKASLSHGTLRGCFSADLGFVKFFAGPFGRKNHTKVDKGTFADYGSFVFVFGSFMLVESAESSERLYRVVWIRSIRWPFNLFHLRLRLLCVLGVLGLLLRPARVNK